MVKWQVSIVSCLHSTRARTHACAHIASASATWLSSFFILSTVLFRAIRRRTEEPETNKIKLSVNSFCLSVRAEQEAINECDTFEFKLCGHTLTHQTRAINGSCILIGPREIRSIAATCIPITFGCSPLVSRPLPFASIALRAQSQTMAINWFCTCCCMICSQYAVAVHTLRP